MAHLHALAVLARADPHKGNPVAVARVHVGLDFENKATELGFCRIDLPPGGLPVVLGERALGVAAHGAVPAAHSEHDGQHGQHDRPTRIDTST